MIVDSSGQTLNGQKNCLRELILKGDLSRLSWLSCIWWSKTDSSNLMYYHYWLDSIMCFFLLSSNKTIPVQKYRGLNFKKKSWKSYEYRNERNWKSEPSKNILLPCKQLNGIPTIIMASHISTVLNIFIVSDTLIELQLKNNRSKDDSTIVLIGITLSEENIIFPVIL